MGAQGSWTSIALLSSHGRQWHVLAIWMSNLFDYGEMFSVNLYILLFTSRSRTQDEALSDSAPPTRWIPEVLGMGKTRRIICSANFPRTHIPITKSERRRGAWRRKGSWNLGVYSDLGAEFASAVGLSIQPWDPDGWMAERVGGCTLF